MANELGRVVNQRYLYARSWSLGDRRSPTATTPCLVRLTDDIAIDAKIAPFTASTDAEIPQTLRITANLPLSPPDLSLIHI